MGRILFLKPLPSESDKPVCCGGLPDLPSGGHTFLLQIVHQIGQTCFVFCDTFSQYLLANALFMP